jgi:hypothetical protein
MWNSFFHLAGKTWGALMQKSSLSTFGFVLFSLLIPIAAGVITSSWAYWKDYRLHKLTLWNIVSSGLEGTLITLGAVSIVVLTTYLIFFVPTIYHLHAAQNTTINDLRKENSHLAGELATRKHTIVATDPTFNNAIYTMNVFKQMHQSMEPSTRMLPCMIYFTATKDSERIASLVMQLANMTSYCYLQGSVGRIDKDDDLYAMAMDGMKPGTVVIHAERGDNTALNLQSSLDTVIPTTMSYEMAKVSKEKLFVSSDYKEKFIWLQFGSGVKWRSEGK